MSFLFPNFLYGLFALSIPILIHLFNLRSYRKVYFTNVSLLSEIEVSTKSVKKLKSLLILACRLLALTFLVFAFSQPFLPVADEVQGSRKTMIIYLDNSYSMKDGGDGNSLFENAQLNALKLIENRADGKILHLVTNDFSTSDFTEFSRQEMQNSIQNTVIGSQSRDLGELISRIEAIAKQGDGAADVYFFSDFQSSQFKDFHSEADYKEINFNFIQLQNEGNGNISIDSCWIENPFLSAESVDTLMVRVSNFTNEVLTDYPLRLFMNNRQVALSTLNLEPWTSGEVEIPISMDAFGSYGCRLEISDGGLNEDNTLYFSFKIDSALRVYHLGSEAARPFFEAAFRPPFLFFHDNEKNVDVGRIDQTDLFILNGESEVSSGLLNEINERVLNGAALVVYFNSLQEVAPINSILSALNTERFTGFDSTSTVISELNEQASLFRNTFENIPENAAYPAVSRRLLFEEKSKRAKEDLLNFEDGKCALRKYISGDGLIYVFAFGLDRKESDFVRNSLFVASLINMANSSRKTTGLYYYLRSDLMIEAPAGTEIREGQLHLSGSGTEVIPEIRKASGNTYIHLHDQMKQSGIYEVVVANEKKDIVSFNYSRRESDTRQYNEDEFTDLIRNSGLEKTSLLSGDAGEIEASGQLNRMANSLWKYCVILAIMFFVAEVMILKFMKAQ